MHTKKNIIISAVGDTSLHKNWIKGKKRNFDLMLIYFGDTENRYTKDADYYLAVKGMFKLENIAFAISKYEDVVKRYDAVWLPDDDMIINARSINTMFDIFCKYNLDLAQPTVIRGACIPITAYNPKYLLRFVNFIEMGCPIFKVSLLFEILSYFTINRSGWGIDFLWSKYCEEHNKKMAMIDCIGLIHKSKVGHGLYYKRLESLGINSHDELEAIAEAYGFNFDPNDMKEFDKVKFSWINYIIRRIRRKIMCLNHNY